GQLGLRRVDRDQDRPEPGGDQVRGAVRRVETCECHDRSLAATASRRYYDRAWLHTVSITMASRFHQGPQDLMIPTCCRPDPGTGRVPPRSPALLPAQTVADAGQRLDRGARHALGLQLVAEPAHVGPQQL